MSMDKYRTDPNTVFVQGVTVADYDALRSRIAELEAIITKTNTHIAYRLDIERQTATEAALRYAFSGMVPVAHLEDYVSRGITALLGEVK